MSLGGRVAALGISALLGAGILTSCSDGPTAAQKRAVHDILTTTTTSTTTTTTTTTPTTSSTSTSTSTTQPGVAVPNVIGLKIAAARVGLRAAGFPSVNLNTPCNKGTLASQSVVASLATPGKAPDVRVGATPLSPGTAIPPGARIGINWSGCYGDASVVPLVVGLPFAAARRAIKGVGLTWSCFSVGKEATTTTHAPGTTSTSTSDAATTTTVKEVPTVLTQSPVADTVLRPGATVTLTMHRCPQ
jgi:beta-lactam-binding protein with PASTA domain